MPTCLSDLSVSVIKAITYKQDNVDNRKEPHEAQVELPAEFLLRLGRERRYLISVLLEELESGIGVPLLDGRGVRVNLFA